MELTKVQKKKTGAFYTPKIWADLAVEYMRKALPLPLEEYMFYDPAGGEGALLESLPKDCKKLATTLEYQDVHIMRDKGIDAYRFDFLNDEMWRVKDRLQEYIDRKRLVVFTNPPFVKLPAKNKSWAHSVYNTNDSIYLFFYRIYHELKATYLCSFNKPLGKPNMKAHGYELYWHWDFLGGFISHSKEHWNLSGSFGIDFNMFDIGSDNFHGLSINNYFVFDVWEKGKIIDTNYKSYVYKC